MGLGRRCGQVDRQGQGPAISQSIVQLNYAEGVAPMRNFLVPQSTQIACVAGRPFFMVTPTTSRESVLALHLTQYICIWVVIFGYFSLRSPRGLWGLCLLIVYCLGQRQCPVEHFQVRSMSPQDQKIATGFTGEPVVFCNRNGLMVTMKVQRLRSRQATASSSKLALSKIQRPRAVMAT